MRLAKEIRLCAIRSLGIIAIILALIVVAPAQCGKERWDVKTASDPEASTIRQTSLTDIKTLASIAAPPFGTSFSTWPRVSPVETTIWTIEAKLIGYKFEPDSDYKLTLVDLNGYSIAVEIPDPKCVNPDSPFFEQISEARREFKERFAGGGNSRVFRRVESWVQVTGIGFFDRYHVQENTPTNGIELHPVLEIRFDIPEPSQTPSSSGSGPVASDKGQATGPTGSSASPGATDIGLLERLRRRYAAISDKWWFWIAKSVFGVLIAYVLGMLALLIIASQFGSTVFDRNWLLSLAIKPLNIAPGLMRWTLFLGYRRRLSRLKEIQQVQKRYFGLPAERSEGPPILPDFAGDKLHQGIVEALGPQTPLLIIGKAGAGKSTLTARLAYLALEKKLSPAFEGYYPILIPAIYYKNALIDAMVDTLRERDGVSLNKEVLESQLRTGRFLILFDDVSQISGDKRGEFENILRVARNAEYKNCRFIITTRPLGESAEDIRSFTLQPLRAEIMLGLLEQYGLGTRKENQLKKYLNSFGDRPIDPLLFTMILEKGNDDDVTTNRSQIYEEYFKKQLRVHNNEDQWNGWKAALEMLAAFFYISTGKRSIGRSHIALINYLGGRNEDDGENDKPGETLPAHLRRLFQLRVDDEFDLLHRLETDGLLQRSLGPRWRFVHDTFEEYFAASYIVSHFYQHEKWPDLSEWKGSNERERDFLEVLDFVLEMTEKSPEFWKQIPVQGFPDTWHAFVIEKNKQHLSVDRVVRE